MLCCYYCSKNFSSSNSFLYHFKICHTPTREYRCGQNNCYRIFSSLISFRKHVHEHFNKVNNAEQLHGSCSSSTSSVPGPAKILPSDTRDIEEEGDEDTLKSLEETLIHSPLAINTDYCDQLVSNINNFVAEMYNNSLVPRQFFQFVISQINSIFCNRLMQNMDKFLRHTRHSKGFSNSCRFFEKFFQ